MTRAKMPSLVVNLRDLSNMLDGWATMLTDSIALQPRLSTDEQASVDLLIERKHLGRYVYEALSTEHATELLLEDGPALIESLRSLLVATAPMHAVLDRTRSSSSRLSAFPAEEYSLSLDTLEHLVSRLTPTHLTVQLHAAAFGSEYWVKHVRNNDSALEQEVYENINKAFYSELLSSRDDYFFEASSENLERYLVIAEELAKREHPLAALAHHVPYIQSSATRRAQAEELLDSLTVASLIAPLFVDEPPVVSSL